MGNKTSLLHKGSQIRFTHFVNKPIRKQNVHKYLNSALKRYCSEAMGCFQEAMNRCWVSFFFYIPVAPRVIVKKADAARANLWLARLTVSVCSTEGNSVSFTPSPLTKSLYNILDSWKASSSIRDRPRLKDT